jgi:hypothetical protein
MTFESTTLLIMFGAINGVALLLLMVSQIGRTTAVGQRSRRPSLMRRRKRKREVEPSEGSSPPRLKGERKLAEDLARWRARAGGGENLPEEAGDCREDDIRSRGIVA